MNGRVVPIRDLSRRDVGAWRSLALDSVEPNPFYEAECLIPASRNLPNGGDILLAIAEESEQFYGCFPLVMVPKELQPSATWPGFRRPTLSTQVRRLRYDGTPLMREDRIVEAATALLTTLANRAWSGGHGIFVMEALDADGPVARSFESAAACLRMPLHVYRSWSRPVVCRQELFHYATSNEYQDGRKLAKMRAKLGEQLGGDVRFVDRSKDPLALDELIRLEASGYKSKVGVALALHPGEPEWLQDMCEQFREEGRVRLYTLEVGDAVVAMNLALLGGDVLFGVQTVFDEDYRRTAPGIQLLFNVIERFHFETNARMLDSCTFAGNETLNRLLPDKRDVTTLLIATGGAFDRTLLRCYGVVQRLLGVDSAFRRGHPRLLATLDRGLARVGLHS